MTRLDAALHELAEAIREEVREAEARPRLLSVDEAADALGISRTSLYQAIRSGSLRTVRLGRRRMVAPADIDALISGTPGEAAPSVPANGGAPDAPPPAA